MITIMIKITKDVSLLFHMAAFTPAATPNTGHLSSRENLMPSQCGVGVAQHALGGVPTDALVRDRLAVTQSRGIGGKGLAALHEVALEHQTDDVVIAGRALFENVIPNLLLVGAGLAGIAVAA